MLSETRQAEKGKYSMISLMYRVLKNSNSEVERKSCLPVAGAGGDEKFQLGYKVLIKYNE